MNPAATALQATSLYNATPSLRSDSQVELLFSNKTSADLDRVEEQLQELTHLWEAALLKTNPWTHRIQDFALTRPTYDEISKQIGSCVSLADKVEAFASTNGLGVAFGGAPSEFISTAGEWREWIHDFVRSDRFQPCSTWLRRFSVDSTLSAIAGQQLEDLAPLVAAAVRTPPDRNLRALLDAKGAVPQERIVEAIDTLKRRYLRGWWTVLTPTYRGASKLWKSIGFNSTLRGGLDGLDSVRRQCQRRLDRSLVVAGLARLGLTVDSSSTDSNLVEIVRANSVACRDATKLATASENNSSIARLGRQSKEETFRLSIRGYTPSTQQLQGPKCYWFFAKRWAVYNGG